MTARKSSHLYSTRIFKTATVAAAALAAATTTSVSALQVNRPRAAAPRTSTSLDYINVAASPETDRSTTMSTDKETRKLEQLEKLFLLGLTTMEQPIPVEIGVAAASPSSTAVPDQVQAVVPKKKRVLKRRRKTGTATTTTTTTTQEANSRLVAAAKLKTKAGKQQQQRRKRGETQSVYWVRRDEKQTLLTREEEIEATDKIRALRRAEHIRDEHLHDQTPLTERQWAAACGLETTVELRKVIRQGQEARSLLVQANMGLVTAIAKRLHASLKQATEAGNGVGTILTLQDFLQEGQIGLMKAADRFDASKGFRFSTYATWWIRQRIQRSINDSSRIIRLPAHVHTKLMKIRRAKRVMKQEIGREPSDPELAHYLEMPVDKLRQYTQSALNVVSLENPLRPTNSGKSDIDTRTLGDTIVSDAPTPLEDAQADCLRRDLEQVLLDALTPTERAVMIARYGLEDGHQKTLEETARAVGVSRERVRLVEAKALNKLRSPQTNYRLKTYIGESTKGHASATKTLKGGVAGDNARKLKAPWGTKTPAASYSSTDEGEGTANPFALPYNYQRRSMASAENDDDTDTGSGAAVQEGTEQEAMHAAAGPDRLWFL